MKLIKNILDYNLSRYNEYMLNRDYIKGISKFYSVYNLCCSVIGYSDSKKLVRKRDKLFLKLIFCNRRDIYDKVLKKIRKQINADMNVVLKAINLIDRQIADAPYEASDFYKDWAVGVLAYEYPE